MVGQSSEEETLQDLRANDPKRRQSALSSLVGEPFLEHLLAGQKDADDIARLHRYLMPLVEDVLRMTDDSIGQLFILNLTAVLSEKVTETKSVGAHLSERVARREPQLVEGSTLEAELTRLIVNSFAADLLPGANLDSGFLNDPSAIRLANLFLDDEDLTKLFPNAKRVTTMAELYDVYSLITSTMPSSGTQQLVMVLRGVTQFALLLMRLADDVHVEGVRQYVASALDLTRRLARGEIVETPCLFGIGGVSVTSRIAGDRWALHPPGNLGLVNNSLEDAEIDEMVVCQVPIKNQILEISGWGISESSEYAMDPTAGPFYRHSSSLQESVKHISEAISTARLAILLSSPQDNVLAPTQRGSGVISALNPRAPYVHLGQSSVSDNQPSILEDAIHLNTCFGLARYLPDGLALGARRLLRAVCERDDPMDALVDAVICWENMVGTNSGDTTLRICGGLSRLIEPQCAASRMEQFNTATSVYSTRSKIVHGSPEPTRDQARKAADDAVNIAVRALRQLLGDKQLREAKPSERSKLLMVGRG